MIVPRDQRIPNRCLRQLREGRGMTQQDLADACAEAGWTGCHLRTIQRYESGETANPPYKARFALERVFGKPIAELGYPHLARKVFSEMEPMPVMFYIFDRVVDSVQAMNARVSACWDWCDEVRARGLDEFIAWGADASTAFPYALDAAIRACRDAGAGLLVHDTATLGGGETVADALERLGDAHLWAVQPAGRVTAGSKPTGHP
jgi:transcriptional regulator with XRE-family HTH domain